MTRHIVTGGFVLLAAPALLLGQSLTELAQEEKERRKKNKESGKEVRVITDTELEENQGRIANPPPGESTESSEPQESGASAGRATAVPSTTSEDPSETREAPSIRDQENLEAEEEAQSVTDIPADASLEQKLSLWERMKASYRQQVAEIDAEIQENNQRIAEIDDELVSTGGTNLPIAPQADRAVRNPGDIPGLRAEQQELRERNQALEAKKRSVRDDIIAKARRAGIPASQLSF